MKDTKINIKSLSDLEKLIGKEQVSKLFIEHYLQMVGKSLKDTRNLDIDEILGLNEDE